MVLLKVIVFLELSGLWVCVFDLVLCILKSILALFSVLVCTLYLIHYLVKDCLYYPFHVFFFSSMLVPFGLSCMWKLLYK